MTPAYWALLVPAVVSVLGAVAAYLKARSTSAKVDTHLTSHEDSKS
jgi:hypothetical protein